MESDSAFFFGESLQDEPPVSKLLSTGLETHMPHGLPRSKRLALVLAGMAVVVFGFCLSAWLETAHAAPAFAPGFASLNSKVTQVRIYRRGRPPIYPYYYNPGRPGGYSFYFGFVPYAKGNIENQAIQRGQYPQDIEWPPGTPGPRPGWGPKAWD
jgi:hypothetical protein